MADLKGKKYDVNPPKIGPLVRTEAAKKYFYTDSKLHRTIRGDRPNDLMRAWSYEDNAVVDFVWSDVRRRMQQAFDTYEVCTLLNRTKKNILEHIAAGAINPPYKIGVQANGFGRYKWSEDDVLAMHAHYLTVGSGRPRKDGMLSAAARIPTKLELVAMMKQQRMMYVRDADGNFVPIFDAQDWT
jgi:hypothetical protein